VHVDARVIAATHRDLVAMSRAGTFREDLLHRINALTLSIPPLRERREAIASFAQRFIDGSEAATGRTRVRGVSEEAMLALESYRWPGNIRELRNVIERACVIAERDEIEPEDLPADIVSARAAHGTQAAGASDIPDDDDHDDGDRDDDGGDDALEYRARVRRFEIELISGALRDTGGNKAAAARLLRMPLRTLAYKVKSLDLGDDES
jgi:DNA-binding NtrC family response regulator